MGHGIVGHRNRRPALAERMEGRRLFAAIVVDTPTDGPHPASQISLRDAIITADTSGTPTTITFDPTVFATPQTITLQSGELFLSNATAGTTITGPATGVTIDGNNASRVFEIYGNATVTLDGLTITHGNANTGNDDGYGGGICDSGGSTAGVVTVSNCTITGNTATHGGGISNGWVIVLDYDTISGNTATYGNGGVESDNSNGRLTATNVVVSGNSAGTFNGAVGLSGRASLTDVTIDSNSAGSATGAIAVESTATATFTRVTATGNSASSGTGGLWVAGAAMVTDCTFSGNTGPLNGGIDNLGTTTVTGTTISGNTASGNDAAGIVSYGTLTVTDSTVAGNIGGGVGIESGSAMFTNATLTGNSGYGTGETFANGLDSDDGSTVTVANSIVAGNAGSAGNNVDVNGAFVSLGHNLIGMTDGSAGWATTDRTGTVAAPLDPMLSPLGDNGGPTRTILPLAGSPAVDGGSNALIPNDVITDQRGLPRIVNGMVDIGAAEKQATGTTTNVTLTSGGGPIVRGQSDLFTAVVSAAESPVTAGTVTFAADAAILATVAVAADGTASYTATALAFGVRVVTATYDGQGTLESATSPAVDVTFVNPVTPDPEFESLARGIENHAWEAYTPRVSTVDTVFTVDKLFPGPDGAFAAGLTSKQYDSVVVFEGTDPKDAFGDWYADFSPIGVGWNQFQSLKVEVENWVTTQRQGGMAVDLTGHSLGGALTQWFAADLTATGIPVDQIVTFNSPGINATDVEQFRAAVAARPGLAGPVTHYIVNGDMVSLAGEAYISGVYKLYGINAAATGPIDYVLTRHGTKLLSGSGATYHSMGNADALGNLMFHYDDPAQYAESIAGLRAALLPTTPNVASALKGMFYRVDAEAARVAVGLAWHAVADLPADTTFVADALLDLTKGDTEGRGCRISP